MHFYEASIITTKDGLHCQVYGNEHPLKEIMVKPKYIPTDHISSDALQYRFIAGKKMNRLNLWSDKTALQSYVNAFQKAYPQYIHDNERHTGDRLFFSIPIDAIERIYFPRRGLAELMQMPVDALDDHLKKVYAFVHFLLGSGLRQKDFGITYSSLMGHYSAKHSDINIVVYGKQQFWDLMVYLDKANHPDLRWKTDDEWMSFYKRRNHYSLFEPDDFLNIMRKKRSEGFFDNTLFVIFAAEKEEETWTAWGDANYEDCGMVTMQGTIKDAFSSIVRPGCYALSDTTIKEGHDDVPLRQLVFYSRDYCMLAEKGQRLEAHGVLEKVNPKQGESYYRLVVGYFDAYLDDRREKEYIKVLV